MLSSPTTKRRTPQMSFSKKLGPLLLSLLLLTCFTSTVAQNSCDDAEDISDSLPYSDTDIIDSSPTEEVFSTSSCRIPVGAFTSWYKYEPEVDALVSATVASLSSQTTMAITSGDICDETLQCIAQRTGTSERSIAFSATAGTTYYISVTTLQEDVSYELTFEDLQLGVDEVNGECTSAIDLSGAIDNYSGVSSYLGGFVTESVRNCFSASPSRVGVWYTFTVATDSVVQASISDSSSSSAIYIMKGSCDALSCVTWDYGERLFGAESGETYYIFVSGAISLLDQTFELSIDSSVADASNGECQSAMDLSGAIGNYSGVSSYLGGFVTESVRNCFSASPSRVGVWYTFTVATDSVVQASISDSSSSSAIYIMKGSCDALSCVTWDYGERLFGAESGETYYIFVSGAISLLDQTFELSIDSSVADASNGECQSAMDLSGAIDNYSGVSSYFGGFVTESLQNCFSASTSRVGVWYSVTVATDSVVQASISDTSISSFIYVMKGSCDALSCVTWESSKLLFGAEADETYYIFVSGAISLFDQTFELSIDSSVVDASNGECQSAMDLSGAIDNYSGVSSYFGGFVTESLQNCFSASTSRVGVWYSVTVAADSVVQASISDSSSSSAIYVMKGSCGALSCVTWDSSELLFGAEVDETYYIFVSGAISLFDQTFELSIDSSELGTDASNGECQSAMDLSGAIDNYSGVSTYLGGFVTESVRNCFSASTSRIGVWYTFTVATDSEVQAIISDAGVSSAIYIMKGSCDALSCVTWDSREHIFGAEADETYYIFVSGAISLFEQTFELLINPSDTCKSLFEPCESNFDCCSGRCFVGKCRGRTPKASKQKLSAGLGGAGNFVKGGRRLLRKNIMGGRVKGA